MKTEEVFVKMKRHRVNISPDPSSPKDVPCCGACAGLDTRWHNDSKQSGRTVLEVRCGWCHALLLVKPNPRTGETYIEPAAKCPLFGANQRIDLRPGA